MRSMTEGPGQCPQRKRIPSADSAPSLRSRDAQTRDSRPGDHPDAFRLRDASAGVADETCPGTDDVNDLIDALRQPEVSVFHPLT